MPRLFTAIALPEDVALGLSFLAGGIHGARWIDRENYHLTLRFMGDIENGAANELADALESVTPARFEIQLSGTGYFGGAKPRALWAGVKAARALEQVQARQERLCQQMGLAPEQRKYTPHVTLARLRGKVSVMEVDHFVARNATFKSRPFEVQSIGLYSSRPSRGGGPYVEEHSYWLR
ncbi:MAG: RNA 2',3'-cyclic phosphodiesterase [Rhizobiales bacterium]|nr:RNA 2',3'-cyclic phosphodiesterase [Hyphomicrobiales bacterium]